MPSSDHLNASDNLHSPDMDVLAECLAIITRIYEKPVATDSLVAGLPIEDGQTSPQVLIRAAERAGYKAELVAMPFEKAAGQRLPLIVLLNNRKACVLNSERESKQPTLVVPGDNQDSLRTIDDIADRYADHIILVEPQYGFSGISDLLKEHWFWSTLKKLWKIYAEVILASLLINLFALAVPLFVMNVYDRVVPNHAIETLWVLATGVGIVLGFDILMKTLRSHFIDRAGRFSDIVLSRKIFAHVLGINLANRPGTVGAFVNNLLEFESFREFLTSTTITVLIDLPFVILFILIIASIGGPIAWIPAIAVLVALIFGLFMQVPLRRIIQQSFQDSARKHASLVETVTGLEAIKSLRAEGTVQRRWEEQISSLADLRLKSRQLTTAITSTSQFIHQAAYILLIVAGVYQIINGNLTMGGLIACSILSGRVLSPMAQIANLLTRFHQSLSAYRSLDNIMAMPIERPSGQNFLHRPDLKGSIDFRKVQFTYPGQPVPTLEDCSFRIDAGERVGIVGRIGSGKSTIQKLIQGFYSCDKGSILIDDTDIRQLDPTDLRGKIGATPQDIYLFNGSVKDNIVLGAGSPDDSEVFRAAEVGGIAAYLQKHPHGFDLQVGERGANLSGGQRQSVAIARTVIRDPAIVLLDEPTNAFDSTTEDHFLNSFREWLGNRTLVLATHKSTPLVLVDRLIVVDQGRVVADGPKEKVIEALAGNQVKTRAQ